MFFCYPSRLCSLSCGTVFLCVLRITALLAKRMMLPGRMGCSGSGLVSGEGLSDAACLDGLSRLCYFSRAIFPSPNRALRPLFLHFHGVCPSRSSRSVFRMRELG